MGTVKRLAKAVERGLEELHPKLRNTVRGKLALAVGALLEERTPNTVELADPPPLATERRTCASHGYGGPPVAGPTDSGGSDNDIRGDSERHHLASGARALHDIGAELHTVDTGSRTVIFHPKLYLVRAKTSARLVVGSANLTLGGLNNNIEAGMWLDFDLAAPEDKAVLDDIEAQLAAMPASYPEHVVPGSCRRRKRRKS